MILRARDALVRMSSLFYEKYGSEVLPIISEVWYELGKSNPAPLRGDSTSPDFKSVLINFHNRAQEDSARRNTVPPRLEELTNSVFHYSHIQDQCPLRLKGRDLCEAIMYIDKGQIEAAMDNPVEFEIIRSAAAGDGCCEIVVRKI